MRCGMDAVNVDGQDACGTLAIHGKNIVGGKSLALLNHRTNAYDAFPSGGFMALLQFSLIESTGWRSLRIKRSRCSKLSATQFTAAI